MANDFLPHSFRWSPDRSLIAYVSGNRLFVFGTTTLANIAPTTLRMLRKGDERGTDLASGPHVHVSPVWLPSGEELLYVSNEGGTRDIYQLSVSAAAGPRGKSHRLTTGLDVLTMSLSADATRLAYSVYRYDQNIWSIPIPRRGTVSVSEAQPVTLGTQAIEGISVSPDGRWLLYDSNRSGNQDIYRLDLSDGSPEQLTTHPADDFLPAWSPNGREIVFYSFRHGSRDIHVMNANGSALQRLTDHPAQERYPDWSPDGNSIVYQYDEGGTAQLRIMSRKGASSEWGLPRQLTVDGGAHPKWSPDGRWIAYRRYSTLRIIPADGGDPRT